MFESYHGIIVEKNQGQGIPTRGTLEPARQRTKKSVTHNAVVQRFKEKSERDGIQVSEEDKAESRVLESTEGLI